MSSSKRIHSTKPCDVLKSSISTQKSVESTEISTDTTQTDTTANSKSSNAEDITTNLKSSNAEDIISSTVWTLNNTINIDLMAMNYSRGARNLDLICNANKALKSKTTLRRSIMYIGKKKKSETCQII